MPNATVLGRNYRMNSTDPLPGLYRARVEYNKDDKQLGRVRVRIPQCHGIANAKGALSFDQLPWAMPCSPFNCGIDYGSFVVPEVGSYVWVMFESGDPTRPVYMGSMYALDSQTNHMMGTMDPEKDPCTRKYGASKGEWVRPAYHNETPVGSFPRDDTTYEPSVSTIYKSPKGATIEIDETDEHESLTLIDRMGQIISLVSPFTVSANEFNKSRRRGRRVDDYDRGEPLDTEDVSFMQKAVIIIRGARNQFLRLVSKLGGCKSELVSKDKDNSASVLSLNSGEKQTLLLSSSDGNACYLILDSKSSEISLVMEEQCKIVSKITIGKSIKLWSTGDIESYRYEDPVDSEFSWVDTEDEKFVRGEVSSFMSYPTDSDHDNR